MATTVTDRKSVLDFLYGRVNYERLAHVPYHLSEFKLDRMRQLLARVGDPHLALKAVHLAGTKGKGSTAAMIAEVLRRAGYKTALYTSPHLERLEERFVIDGCRCPEDEFVSLATELIPAVEEMDREGLAGGAWGGLTFFEITTALGFLYFARHNVDVAVLEVGLGGRLDSTNVCRPEITIITSISYDHTRQLGNTLAEIAGEKAGIIKPGVPVVSGVTADEPRLVIEQIAREQGAPLIQRGLDFDFTMTGCDSEALAQRFNYWQRGPRSETRLDNLELSLLGAHQCANAALAVAALSRLGESGWTIPEDALRQGLAGARCDARVEVLQRNPTVVLDVAHNVASVEALIDVLRQRFPGSRQTLIFATSRDKDVRGMLEVLVPSCETLILTRYMCNPRAMETVELEAIARSVAAGVAGTLRQILVEPTPQAAWNRARQVGGDLIGITGSFFLAADMTAILRN